VTLSPRAVSGSASRAAVALGARARYSGILKEANSPLAACLRRLVCSRSPSYSGCRMFK
jgi:hypothetical protein